MVQRTDYYLDLKYCRACDRYVRYISAPLVDHCIECDARVWLFSDEDRSVFERAGPRARDRVHEEE